MLFNKKKLFLPLAVLAMSTQLSCSNSKNAKVVDFGKCFTDSQYGAREQETLTSMKDQMEKAMKELNDQMTEVSAKLNDEEVLESLSPEAEKELAEKMQTLSGEMQRYQQQYYYMMQQANMRTMNVMADKIKQASKTLAQKHNYSMVINKEQVFYFHVSDDVTADLITELDSMYNSEQENASKIKSELSKNAAN